MPTGEVLLRCALAAVVGYLLGSLPSGVLVSRLFGRADPRTKGSGKTGATNILRTHGAGPAILVGALDIGKGVAAVLVARFIIFPVPAHASTTLYTLQALAEAIAGFGALLGHNHSIFIRFTGGRGVATGGGCILAMNPLTLGIGAIGFIVPIALTKYVSLGSVIGAATAGLASLGLTLAGRDYWPHALFALLGGAFIIYAHRDNIQRLMAGTERKLGQSAS